MSLKKYIRYTLPLIGALAISLSGCKEKKQDIEITRFEQRYEAVANKPGSHDKLTYFSFGIRNNSSKPANVNYEVRGDNYVIKNGYKLVLKSGEERDIFTFIDYHKKGHDMVIASISTTDFKDINPDNNSRSLEILVQ